MWVTKSRINLVDLGLEFKSLILTYGQLEILGLSRIKCEYTDISSVLDTTLMSWDAILYDVKNGRVICRDEYFSDLSKNRLN